MQVVIVGAGIIGANLAFALSRLGADVTIVDEFGLTAGASGRSFGWVNACFYADKPHFELRREGIASYRRLARLIDARSINWSGCLCWEEHGRAFDKQAADLAELGYSVTEVDAETFGKLEPHVSAPKRALHFADEAAVDAADLTATLIAASNAKVITGCKVEAIETTNSKTTGVRLVGGVLPADKVIVACGTGSTGVLASVGVSLPMLERPGIIMRSKPVAPMLSHVLVAPQQEFRQLPSGHILAPTVASHQADESEKVETRPDVLADIALTRLNKLMPSVGLEWEEVSLALRPVPKDGLPVVGACGPDGLFTAVMHSGVTLAPVVAEILAQEVLEQLLSNHHADLIANYRPDRFQS